MNKSLTSDKRKPHYIFSSYNQLNIPSNVSYEIRFYYQLCGFANPYTKRYHLRKYVINENYEFITVTDEHLTRKQCKKFIRDKKEREYKIYSVYTLDNIAPPSFADINTSFSELLN